MNSLKTEPLKLSSYYLVGPTAVGKSAVAQFIAEKKGRNILSADSMLVYRGMDIGTAKPGMDSRGSVKYYGIDLVEPDSPFSVWEYMEHVRSVADGLSGCIVTGGTGLYVQCLLGGLIDLPGADYELRMLWTAKVENEGVESLQEFLNARYPAIYSQIEDKQNVRRLIRALEAAEGGVVVAPERSWRQENLRLPGLLMSRDDLVRRIEARVDVMYGSGLIDEVRGLRDKYPVLSPTAAQAIGYSETIELLDGTCSLDEAKEKVVTRTRRLAKRQMTWFRNKMDIDWITISAEMEVSDIAELVLSYWEDNGPAHIRTD